MSISLTYFPALMLLAGALAACGGKSKKRDISEEPQRQGSALSTVDRRFNDFQPALSDDGSRVVFLSGRDSAPGQPTHKAYRLEWAAGAAPGAPVRVHAQDVGVERDVAVSGDGAWVALVGVSSALADLYLIPYGDAAVGVRVGDDAKSKARPRFSPGGELLAWISRNATGTLKLVAIGGGTAAELAADRHVSIPGGDVQDAFWLPTSDASFALVAGAAAAGQGRLTYTVRRFATLAAAASAEAEVLIDGVLPPRGVFGVATAGAALIARRALAYEARLVARVGDIEPTLEAPAPTIVLDAEAIAVDLAAGTSQPFAGKPGYQVLDLGAGTGAGFAAMRYFYGCKDEGEGFFGTGIAVSSLDGTEPAVLVPKLTEAASDTDLKFGVAVGFCDKLKNPDRPEDGRYRLDDKVMQLAVSRSSTATKFRLAYVSQFSHRFDADCRLKSGDQEIMALEVDGESRTTYPISANRATLSDSPHDPPCTL